MKDQKNTHQRDIDLIVIHCTATRGSHDIGVAEIDSLHRCRGFRSIGYHYVVRLDGTIETGRPESEAGAHCSGHNARSVGVVYCGGLDERNRPADTRTPAQRTAMLGLLRELRRRYPAAEIRSHRDFAPKACPCFDATLEYAGL